MNKTRTYSARRHLLLSLLLFSFISGGAAPEIGRKYPEAKIKAAYLFNFLRFIDWPEDHPSNTHICVIGDNKKYHDALFSLSSQTLDDQNILIKEFPEMENIQELKGCRIIFVTDTASHRQKLVFNTMKGIGALTVGESRGFAQQGGMINFIEQDDTVRFEINLHAVNEANLRITSRILRIAARVIE